MGATENPITLPADDSDDRKPVDSLAVAPRPPALAADGERVSCAEVESAAELSRMARRLGLDKYGINGFRLYAAYVAYRDLRRRVDRGFARVRSFAGRPR